MILLILASLIWSFSFGLMKTELTGLDPSFVAWGRILVAIPLFLPFFRKRNLSAKLTLHLLGIGAFQYGILYAAYTYSFQYLNSYEVALFTIFTPIYVTLIDNIYKRHFEPLNFGMSLLAIVGAAIIRYENAAMGDFLTGFLLVQVASIVFAYGQIEYRRLRRIHTELVDQEVYAVLYMGALLLLTAWTTYMGGWSALKVITDSQVYAILYLGSIATGLAFFLWNVGAVRTHAGPLAIMNNVKIPLAVVVSLVVFGESANLTRLLLGGGIMIIAVYLAERFRKPQKS